MTHEKFICPFCGTLRSHIVNVRFNRTKRHNWRRRLCLSCGETYTTTETVKPIDRPSTRNM